MDYRTHAPLAHSWVAHPFRGEGGAALGTLCHADGGWKMRSCSNEKDIQWMQRTLADLKAKIDGSRSVALSTFPQPDFSVSAPKSL